MTIAQTDEPIRHKLLRLWPGVLIVVLQWLPRSSLPTFVPGSDRDGIIRGVRIEIDWSQLPPVELWGRPIGPRWSSFASLATGRRDGPVQNRRFQPSST